MIIKTNQAGFSAVELLVTLFVAAAFLISGYQLYTFAVRDGGTSRAQAIASREADNYVQKYTKDTAITDPCTPATLKNQESVTIAGLSNPKLTVNIECPPISSSTSRVKVTLTYGTPTQTLVTSTYTKPDCPSGFIPVPGSRTYGTHDFCVMKYEAQQKGASAPDNTIPVSVAGKWPWMTSQNNAMTVSKNACTGCHLITEAEWLTIAENILSNPASWRGGQIGLTNYSVAEGHSRNNPAGALPPSADDNDIYYREDYDNDGIYQEANDICPPSGIPSCMFGSNQSRVLRLTNGEAIWDFTGNAWEWTAGQTIGGQPGDTTGTFRNWNALSSAGSLSPNPFPSFSNVSGASGWDCTFGIGKVFSSTTDTALRGFIRGGGGNDNGTTGCVSGLYALILNNAPSFDNGAISFRVAK